MADVLFAVELFGYIFYILYSSPLERGMKCFVVLTNIIFQPGIVIII